MERETKVRFYYFYVDCIDNSNNLAVRFNFEECFYRLYQNYLGQNNDPLIFDIYGDEDIKVKLEDIGFHIAGVDTIYRLCFSKMRNFALPKKSKENGVSEDLDLSDDEYVSEEMTILYDVHNNIVMLQVNGHSINYKAVERCLNTILQTAIGNDNLNLVLKLLVDRNTLNNINNKKSFTKTISINVNNNSEIINNIFSSYNEDIPRGIKLELKLSIDRRTDFSEEFIPETIVERMLNEDNKNKFVIKVKEENRSLEELDLFNGKLEDYVNMNYREGRSLRSISVFENMLRIYFSGGKIRALNNI